MLIRVEQSPEVWGRSGIVQPRCLAIVGLHTKEPEFRGVPAPDRGRIRGGRGMALRHEGSLVAEGRMAVRGRQHGEQSGFTMSVGTCLV